MIPYDPDFFDESWRLRDTIYKTSAEAQLAIEQLERELAALSYHERLDSKIGWVISHTHIVRDLLKEQEDAQI